MKIIGICLCLWFTSIEKLIAEECSNSTTNNWIAISTDSKEERCPVPKSARLSFWDSKALEKKSMYYSQVCMNQLNSPQTEFILRNSQTEFSLPNSQSKRPKDFKTHCGVNGNACKSGTTTVDFKQCYPG